MVKRRLHGFVGMTLAVSVTGCTIPANSPLTGLAQIRPVATPHTNVLPPAAMLHHPGPGVEGPGPGVIAPASYEMALDAAAAEAGMAGGGGLPGANLPVSQVGFIGPDGMQVRWDVSALGGFDSTPLVTPGRYDFAQGAIYRLKVTDIPGRPGIELYPTLEVAPVTPRTDAFLAHNSVPFQLTEEDLDQVTTGNFVTKVVYLPDPDYQELAVAGVETLVSTRLDPGCDPIVEADRRGSILAIIRIGNKDLEAGGPGMAGGAPMGVGPGGGGPGGGGVCPTGGVMPLGMPCGGNPGQMPPAFMAGMTAPQYGLPYTGTPIGLPGPAHIPLGVPAGLQKHTITNHTKMHIPPPTRELKLHVQQYPGLSYPKPAHRAYIAERSDVPNIRLRQPVEERTRYSDNGGPDADTAAGECPPAPENYLP